MTSETSQRVAVVAGGGSGIGRGCALKLATLGYHVVLVGRDSAKLDTVVKEIADAGGSAAAFPGDVRNWDRMAELQASVAEQGVDLLVNSAGGQFFAPTAEISKNGWHAVVDTNLSGTFYLCRHLYPSLKKRGGSIVTMVANMWRVPAPNLAHSGAARAGIVNLTRTLALEWARDGIRVNAISPGVTDTPALSERFRKRAEKVPLGRIGTVDDMVEAVLYLAKASYVTGEVLTVDGGIGLT
jgi:citronellol/citronellal dehydrogenase